VDTTTTTLQSLNQHAGCIVPPRQRNNSPDPTAVETAPAAFNATVVDVDDASVSEEASKGGCHKGWTPPPQQQAVSTHCAPTCRLHHASCIAPPRQRNNSPYPTAPAAFGAARDRLKLPVTSPSAWKEGRKEGRRAKAVKAGRSSGRAGGRTSGHHVWSARAGHHSSEWLPTAPKQKVVRLKHVLLLLMLALGRTGLGRRVHV
jgi:hypothetical protein